MKTKRLILAWSILLCLLLYACVQDEWFINKEQEPSNELSIGKNKELTIAAANSWYSNNEAPVTRMAVTDNNMLGILVAPSWNHAKEWKKGHYEVVEASLLSNMNVLFYEKETYSQKEKMTKEEKKRIMNVGRAVILKDIITGKIITFNMVIIGSRDYLMQSNELSNNSYLYRESKFDGMVLFFHPDGYFVNGWKYENGKITKRLSPITDFEDLLPDSNSLPSTRASQDCYTNYYTYTYLYCPSTRAYTNDWISAYSSGEFGNENEDKEEDGTIGGGTIGEVEVVAPHCYWVTEDIPYIECIEKGDPTGGYQEGESGNVTPSTPNSRLEKIFKNTDQLTEEQLKKLEDAIEEMERKMCYSKAILNYLEEKGVMFNSVYIDPNLAGNAGSTIINEDINLGFREENFIRYGTVNHELVHLLQTHLGLYINNDCRGMMEYERSIIDDIMFFAQFKGNKKKIPMDAWLDKHSPMIYTDSPDPSNKEEYEEWKKQGDAYMKWLSKITKNGTPSSISVSDFQQWKPLFYENSRSYPSYPNGKYKYDIEYSPKALLKVLELAQDCN